MTPDYQRYNNLINDNLSNAINNLINNFNNHRIINHPIEQIIPKDPVGIPVVDGYVFNGWDEDPIVVRGQLINETNYYFGEEEIPVGEPATVGRPIFPPWALDVCVIIGRKI
jgi:hypothetical protein